MYHVYFPIEAGTLPTLQLAAEAQFTLYLSSSQTYHEAS